MKLYKIIANNRPTNGGTDIIWVGSQAEAGSTRKKLVEEGRKRTDLVTEEVDVPTSKQDLLGWLNANVNME